MPKKWSIYDAFYVLLLDYDITKKKQVDKTTTQLKSKAGDNSKKYEVEKIWDSVIDIKEAKSHLASRYYLVI